MEHGNIKISLCMLGYSVLGWLFFFIVFPIFALISSITGRHRNGLKERLGFYRPVKRTGKPCIWLHAASVGEAQAADLLLNSLRKRIPEAKYFVTTVTEQGREVARQLMGENALVLLAPLDFSFAVSRAIKFIGPDIFVNLETELWPQLLHRLHRSGVKMYLTNGRISARSFARYRLLGTFMRYLLGHFKEISVIGQDDAKRFNNLGADPHHLHVTGNIKLDPGAPRPGDAKLTALQGSLGLTENKKVFACGSTRTGEEEILLPVYLRLKEIVPDLLWLIAPRHLERLAEVEGLLRNRGISWQRLSLCRKEGRSADVILVDTIGELKLLYGLATYVFCGGSLVPKGGHNIMEPVVWGRPVLYGPSMNDFVDAKNLVEESGIGFEVASADELLAKIVEWDRSPELYHAICQRALQLARQQHKIADRQADIITSSH